MPRGGTDLIRHHYEYFRGILVVARIYEHGK